MHSDPAFAAAAGFDRLTPHGLCTYGIDRKAIVDNLLDGDVSQVASVHGSPGSCCPGETLQADIWNKDGRFVDVLTAPSPGQHDLLSGVVLVPA